MGRKLKTLTRGLVIAVTVFAGLALSQSRALAAGSVVYTIEQDTATATAGAPFTVTVYLTPSQAIAGDNYRIKFTGATYNSASGFQSTGSSFQTTFQANSSTSETEAILLCSSTCPVQKLKTISFTVTLGASGNFTATVEHIAAGDANTQPMTGTSASKTFAIVTPVNPTPTPTPATPTATPKPGVTAAPTAAPTKVPTTSGTTSGSNTTTAVLASSAVGSTYLQPTGSSLDSPTTVEEVAYQSSVDKAATATSTEAKTGSSKWLLSGFLYLLVIAALVLFWLFIRRRRQMQHIAYNGTVAPAPGPAPVAGQRDPSIIFKPEDPSKQL